MGDWLRMNYDRRYNMRLQNLYFMGALAVAAIPLSAGAQSLPASGQSTSNSETVSRANQKCPPG